MDLGLNGKRAVVCASSKGLGRGCAEALAGAGVSLILNARGVEALEETAQFIRDTHGVDVTTVAADVATRDGRAALIAAAGDVDILVTNAGGPPPGLWSDWDRDDFIAALDAKMLAPVALMQATLRAAQGIDMDTAKKQREATIPARRYGTAAEFGATCAFLCSQHAGFIVGQNIVLDGGAINATI